MTILRILLAIALLAAIAACGYAAYILLSSLIGRLLPLISWLLCPGRNISCESVNNRCEKRLQMCPVSGILFL